jgi:putative ABC transport system permease protein
LGARKKDIKNLFNAETFIIGLASGLFGVAVSYTLSFAINAILGALTGLTTLCSLPVLSAFIMVCVSIGLTLISGLIPAGAAAKKDPVIALRTE